LERNRSSGLARLRSIGIAVFSGMLASTCLAVLFVPSFFVVVRRFEEWRAARKGEPAKQAASTDLRPSARNENPPRISPGGPIYATMSSASSQRPVHPRSSALSLSTVFI